MDVIEYVVGFVFCREAVLLIRKARPEWQRNRYNGIGGKVEPGETPVAAMARECDEETNGALHIAPARWTHFATLAGDDSVSRFREGAVAKQFRVYFYTTTLEYWPSPDPENATHSEDEPVFWMLVDAAMQSWKCLPNLEWLIPLAKAAPRVASDLPYLITERAGAQPSTS